MQDARFAKVVTRRADLRFPFPDRFAARLEGQTISMLERRGKHLIARLSSGDVLLMHLGMSGSFRIDAPGDPQAAEFYHERGANGRHDHVVFRMSSGVTITFNDPRRFGSMDLVSPEELRRHATLSALGPEPLDPAFDAETLARACAGKKTTLKAALSDQRVVAGLGNIYVCEALHRAKLSPKRRASTIATRTGAPNDHAVRLVDGIRAVLNDAVKAGGSSLRDHRQTDGALGMFQHNFRVYDREGERCVTPGCKGTIKRIVQTGRSTFFCPVCQK